MTAAQRIETLDRSDPAELCAKTDQALTRLVDILSRETMLLRAGKLSDAAGLAAGKTQAAEDYTVLARAVQRQAERLHVAIPDQLDRLKRRHESLATQMAENLRVLATARTVAEDLLADVARAVGAEQGNKTYGATGATPPAKSQAAGLAINRAL
ncbi:MAG: hypothetical protein KKH72_14325 [Alphaproteobacteria bacterium]|nr:hypothetical protein [Alphaproteobacteria bacterium]